MKHRELSKGLANKFTHELMPFAYYAIANYDNKPEVRFKPCCGSEPYDGIIVDNDGEIFVEITNAINGEKWGLQKELLVEDGYAPCVHNIEDVEGNKTKRNRSASDINTTNELVSHTDWIRVPKELVKEKIDKKCKKSMGQNLPYGKDKTVLIVTFDDTGFVEDDRNDFVNFKRTKLDSMEHNFIEIILFGWISKKFIPENV